MRVPSLVFLAALSVPAVAVSACGRNVVQGEGATGSSGGSGGSVTVTTTDVTTTTTALKDAGPDVDNGMVSTTYPAFKPSVPQVVTGGGPVVASPKLVPVFFPNDSYQAQLTDFVAKLGATKWWADTTSEYFVGPAVGQPAVVLTEAAPSSIADSDIQTWLAGKLNGTDPVWPAPDANTIYVLHYPASTTITQASGGQTAQSCRDFGGYHNNVALDASHSSQNVAYAVVPRCGSFGNLHGIDAVTGAESHEIVESATDPHPMADTAYGQVDNNHLYWEFALGGGETGDMCAQFPGVFTKFTELDYAVQRSWSNKAAAAGKDPCVPELPGEVYFNASPLLKDNINISGLGSVKGVKIPVGGSGVVELDLFSEADTGGPWNVEVKDFAQLMGGAATMAFSLDRDSGQNGEKLHLTIDVLTKNQYGVGIFLVISSLGQHQNWWVGLVGN